MVIGEKISLEDLGGVIVILRGIDDATRRIGMGRLVTEGAGEEGGIQLHQLVIFAFPVIGVAAHVAPAFRQPRQRHALHRVNGVGDEGGLNPRRGGRAVGDIELVTLDGRPAGARVPPGGAAGQVAGVFEADKGFLREVVLRVHPFHAVIIAQVGIPAIGGDAVGAVKAFQYERFTPQLVAVRVDGDGRVAALGAGVAQKHEVAHRAGGERRRVIAQPAAAAGDRRPPRRIAGVIHRALIRQLQRRARDGAPVVFPRQHVLAVVIF